MKRFAPLSTLLIAGVTAGLLATTASAGMADYTQLEQSVRAGLESLGVSTGQLGQLTMDQVAQLSAILDREDSGGDKAQAAAEVIANAVNPRVVSMTSPEGRQLLATLKADMDRVGLTYPHLDRLSAVQVQEVIDVFGHHKKDGERAKQAAEAIFANFDRPADVTVTNAGLIQLENQMDAQLTTLGITPPSPSKLTFDQVSQLTAIFEAGGPEADQKAAALKVLGIS